MNSDNNAEEFIFGFYYNVLEGLQSVSKNAAGPGTFWVNEIISHLAESHPNDSILSYHLQ